MINILIAEDSRTETDLFKNIIQKENDMCVVACATNGLEVIELAAKLKPDLITMDINMPDINGLEATKIIMQNNPTPIVVISSAIKGESLDKTFLALEAGAVNVMAKPKNILGDDFEQYCKKMISMLRGMSEIKVVTRRTIHKASQSSKNLQLKTLKAPYYDLIAIGSSVGGPEVLKQILSRLPANYPLPIVIVQHMMAGFIAGFSDWLNVCCHLNVKCVENNEYLKPGVVYLAPDKYHLKIEKTGDKLIAKLHKGNNVYGFCPSISVMMHSVADVCGKNAIGILLTGMGSDGADGLLSMKRKHAHTLVQDQESSVVFGMASVAQSLGAVDSVISPNKMTNYLLNVIYKNSH